MDGHQSILGRGNVVMRALHDRAAASLLLGSIGVFALVDLNTETD